MRSMRNSGTPHTIANTIRMLRTHHHGAFLIVEGDTDARIYRQLVDVKACHVQPADGKRNVVGAIGMLTKGRFKGAIGVVDADYSIILGKVSPHTNVFTTDSHDLETMILQSKALDKVLGEYGNAVLISRAKSSSGLSVQDLLIRAAAPVGCLRLLSVTRSLGLKFDRMNFSAFVDKTTLCTDMGLLINEVCRNTGRSISSVPVTVADINAEVMRGHDPWHLCCGHDLVEILSIGLQCLFGSRPSFHVKPVVLELSLRLAYEQAYFSSTRLHGHLQTWEHGHAPYKVLAS